MYFRKKIEITDYLKQYQFSIPSCIPTFLTVVRADAEKSHQETVLVTQRQEEVHFPGGELD